MGLSPRRRHQGDPQPHHACAGRWRQRQQPRQLHCWPMQRMPPSPRRRCLGDTHWHHACAGRWSQRQQPRLPHCWPTQRMGPSPRHRRQGDPQRHHACAVDPHCLTTSPARPRPASPCSTGCHPCGPVHVGYSIRAVPDGMFHVGCSVWVVHTAQSIQSMCAIQYGLPLVRSSMRAGHAAHGAIHVGCFRPAWSS